MNGFLPSVQSYWIAKSTEHSFYSFQVHLYPEEQVAPPTVDVDFLTVKKIIKLNVKSCLQPKNHKHFTYQS